MRNARKRGLSFGIAVSLILTLTSGAGAGTVYDLDWGDTPTTSALEFKEGKAYLYPGDSLEGVMTLYMGKKNLEEGKAASLGDNGQGQSEFTNTTGSVYTIEDVSDQFDSPVPSYLVRGVGYAIEVVNGTAGSEESGQGKSFSADKVHVTYDDGSTESVKPQATWYAKGTELTIKPDMDHVPAGKHFARWDLGYIDSTGSIVAVDDPSSYGLDGLSKKALKKKEVTFTMDSIDHVLIFTADYADGEEETDPPETNPPETNPPETNPPETNPPETNPPVINPPETNPPETGAPKAPPETNAPQEINPPETNPPETNPPETNPPETQAGTTAAQPAPQTGGQPAAQTGVQQAGTVQQPGSLTPQTNLSQSESTAPMKYVITASQGVSLNLTQADAGQTIVASYPQQVNAGIAWAITDTAGNTVPYSTADSAGWTVQFQMPSANVALTVTVTPYEIYHLRVSHGNGDGDYYGGTTLTVNADAADPGFAFSGWTIMFGSGTFNDASQPSTLFTTGFEETRIRANYIQTGSSITIVNGEGSGVYPAGSTISLTPSAPEAGKEFSNWVVTEGTISIDQPDAYNAVATVGESPATITAVYKDGPLAEDSEITGILEGDSFRTGERISFTAVGAGSDNSTPNIGDYRFTPDIYQVGSASGNYAGAPYTINMTVNRPGSYTITVTFAREIWDGTAWQKVQEDSSISKSVTFSAVQEAGKENAEKIGKSLISSSAAVIAIARLYQAYTESSQVDAGAPEPASEAGQEQSPEA